MRTAPVRIGFACFLAFGAHSVCAQYQEDSKGYVLMQAEKTASPLGIWKLASNFPGVTGTGHLEFMGNNTADGPATSPLDYHFTITQAGDYTLYVSIYQDLQGAGGDQCNDVYVRVTGDYTSGAGGAQLSILQQDTKLFGGSGTTFTWSSDASLEPSGTTHVSPKYAFKAGQSYTLTLSGRSLRTAIDRILFTTAASKSVGQDPKTPESLDKVIPQGPRIVYKSLVDFQKIAVPGYANYSNDPVMSALYINAALDVNHSKWAAAEVVFNGDPGLHDIILYALKETDGETDYKIILNGKQLGTTFKNSSINLDSRRIGEVQTFTISGQQLKKGDVIRIESDCTTNKLVPKDSTFSFAEGRWSKVELVPKFVTKTAKTPSATAFSFDLLNGYLHFSPAQIGLYTLRFFESSGQLALTRKINVSGNSPSHIRVETPSLRPGAYVVSLTGNGLHQVQHIVLSKNLTE